MEDRASIVGAHMLTGAPVPSRDEALFWQNISCLAYRVARGEADRTYLSGSPEDWGRVAAAKAKQARELVGITEDDHLYA